MKVRNILLIISIGFVLTLFISALIERSIIQSRASELAVMLKTSADMALEQVQLVDDYMGYGDNEVVKMKFPESSGGGYKETDIFHAILGLDSSVETNKDAIYNLMYNNNEMKSLMERTNAIRKPVRYYNNGDPRNGLAWYTIPIASMLGTDYLPMSNLTVKDSRDVEMPDAFAQSLYRDYSLKDYTKRSGSEVYYNTPLNIGITYINKEFLGSVFMTNVDLMMRGKQKNNLNTYEGGSGIVKGATFADTIVNTLEHFNPIHNGKFAVLRYDQVNNGINVNAYKGITPDVEYRVIDMYDPANDVMLEYLFGGYKGSFSSKAMYLRNLDEETINPMTGYAYTSKPIVVAKVSFYLDIVVPYFMLTNRELRSTFGDAYQMIEIAPSEDDVSNLGVRRMVYTRYFAVTP